MTDQSDAIDRLIEQVAELDQSLAQYLDLWPSPRISHARPGYLAAALRKELERSEGATRRDLAVAANAVDREVRMEYTPFEIEMAAIRKARGWPGGHTPAEYRAMQAEARANMGPEQSQEDVDRIMKGAG